MQNSFCRVHVFKLWAENRLNHQESPEWLVVLVQIILSDSISLTNVVTDVNVESWWYFEATLQVLVGEVEERYWIFQGRKDEESWLLQLSVEKIEGIGDHSQISKLPFPMVSIFSWEKLHASAFLWLQDHSPCHQWYHSLSVVAPHISQVPHDSVDEFLWCGLLSNLEHESCDRQYIDSWTDLYASFPRCHRDEASPYHRCHVKQCHSRPFLDLCMMEDTWHLLSYWFPPHVHHQHSYDAPLPKDHWIFPPVDQKHWFSYAFPLPPRDSHASLVEASLGTRRWKRTVYLFHCWISQKINKKNAMKHIFQKKK